MYRLFFQFAHSLMMIKLYAFVRSIDQFHTRVYINIKCVQCEWRKKVDSIAKSHLFRRLNTHTQREGENHNDRTEVKPIKLNIEPEILFYFTFDIHYIIDYFVSKQTDILVQFRLKYI